MNYLLEISNGTWLSLRHRNGYQKLELKERILWKNLHRDT